MASSSLRYDVGRVMNLQRSDFALPKDYDDYLELKEKYCQWLGAASTTSDASSTVRGSTTSALEGQGRGAPGVISVRFGGGALGGNTPAVRLFPVTHLISSAQESVRLCEVFLGDHFDVLNAARIFPVGKLVVLAVNDTAEFCDVRAGFFELPRPPHEEAPPRTTSQPTQQTTTRNYVINAALLRAELQAMRQNIQPPPPVVGMDQTLPVAGSTPVFFPKIRSILPAWQKILVPAGSPAPSSSSGGGPVLTSTALPGTSVVPPEGGSGSSRAFEHQVALPKHFPEDRPPPLVEELSFSDRQQRQERRKVLQIRRVIESEERLSGLLNADWRAALGNRAPPAPVLVRSGGKSRRSSEVEGVGGAGVVPKHPFRGQYAELLKRYEQMSDFSLAGGDVDLLNSLGAETGGAKKPTLAEKMKAGAWDPGLWRSRAEMLFRA